jgi:hypothetical protein
MAIDRDLMLSIFALDSYNRGYAAGTNITGTGLGTAIELLDRPSPSIGFYGIAYSWSNEAGNETVISYRGTDDPGPDITNGFGIGMGLPSAPQGLMAVQPLG